MEYITSNKGGRKLAFENNIYIKQKVLSNGTVWGDIMGGFCPGEFCPGGFCPRGGGILSGGFCPRGFCPRTEMLDSAAPYYQAGLGNRLCYELTFNDYNRVIKSAVSPKVPDAKYKITDISLEYEIVTQPDLARSIRSEYQHMALLYDRILRHRQLSVNKSDTMWNWSFHTPCKSLKGILVLFEEEKSYTRYTSKFYNPGIQKVSVTVESKPNQLYSQGMRSFELYDEARKYFAEGRLANDAQTQLQFYDVSLGEYLVNNYALWLDFRTIDENELHKTGRRIENASEGIILQIEKKAGSAGALSAYIYLIMDAQLNIQSGTYVYAIY